MTMGLIKDSFFFLKFFAASSSKKYSLWFGIMDEGKVRPVYRALAMQLWMSLNSSRFHWYSGKSCYVGWIEGEPQKKNEE